MQSDLQDIHYPTIVKCCFAAAWQAWQALGTQPMDGPTAISETALFPAPRPKRLVIWAIRGGGYRDPQMVEALPCCCVAVLSAAKPDLQTVHHLVKMQCYILVQPGRSAGMLKIHPVDLQPSLKCHEHRHYLAGQVHGQSTGQSEMVARLLELGVGLVMLQVSSLLHKAFLLNLQLQV